MRLHSLQIIPGEHFPETAIVDVMLQPNPAVQSFRHVRASLVEFLDLELGGEDKRASVLALCAWAEGLKERVADAA